MLNGKEVFKIMGFTFLFLLVLTTLVTIGAIYYNNPVGLCGFIPTTFLAIFAAGIVGAILAELGY